MKANDLVVMFAMIAFATTLALLNTGCSDSNFAGTADKDAKELDDATDADELSSDAELNADGDDGSGSGGNGQGGDGADDDEGGGADEDGDDGDEGDDDEEEDEEQMSLDQVDSTTGLEGVGKCLQNMGLSSVAVSAVEDVKYLETSAFSPFANSSVMDDEKTEKQRVVVIKMTAFGPVVNFDLNLLNPNGLYCIMTGSFSVFTNKKITICKKAKIASDVASYTNIQTTANLLRVGCD